MVFIQSRLAQFMLNALLGLILVSILAIPCASAQTPAAVARETSALKVEEAWVRGTVDGQRATGAFMTLTAAVPMRLVSANSSLASVVEIHEMRMEGDVMRMRPVKNIELPAGKAIELKPGGYHLMLLDLRRSLKAGEGVPIRLQIEHNGKRQTVQIEALVRSAATLSRP